MPPLFSTLFLLFLFYSPFLFIAFIPAKTILHSNNKRYDVCTTLQQFSFTPLWALLDQNLCRKEQTLAVIKPDGIEHASTIKDIFTEHGFVIVASKTKVLEKATVDQWYHDKVNMTFYPSLQRYLTRGPIELLLLERVDAVSGLRSLIGPTDPEVARQRYPHSIRALLGASIQENAIHASDSPPAVTIEKALLMD